MSPSKLLMPLDTHIHSVCKGLGFTARKAADFKTVMEITEVFRQIRPRDPVRYDFALSRLGIRLELDLDQVVQTLMGISE